MSRAKTTYRCSECGWSAAKWVGRCPECSTWGSVAETAAAQSRAAKTAAVTSPALPIAEVSAEASVARSTGVAELDRVLGGGLVPGAAVLLAGEPGVGKSTLLLEVAAQTARQGRRTLYVTGEESAAQVRLRADRTGAVTDELYLAAETDLGALLTHAETVRPELLVVDSIQTIGTTEVDGVPGGVTQVREVAAALIRMAKLHDITLVLVGHVTKDGSIAGPRVLEHLVDTVLQFEGDRSSRLRLACATKNRFGPVDEIGCFELTSDGIVAVTDPSGLFLDARHGHVPGTCVAVTLEGRRALMGEVQALVTESSSERPRRTTSGVDSSRVAMILAILQQHLGLNLARMDVFVSSVGGARLHDPAADLAIAMALVSAYRAQPIGRQAVAIGELGLSGELRRVRDTDARVVEAGRLGVHSAVVPAEAERKTVRMVADVKVAPAANLVDALELLGLLEAPAGQGRDSA